MALAVCADPVYRAPLLEGAVQTDNIMVADGLESHKTMKFGDLGSKSSRVRERSARVAEQWMMISLMCRIMIVD